MKLVKDTNDKNLETKQVSDKQAEEAFRTILTWMGEDQIEKVYWKPLREL